MNAKKAHIIVTSTLLVTILPVVSHASATKDLQEKELKAPARMSMNVMTEHTHAMIMLSAPTLKADSAVNV